MRELNQLYDITNIFFFDTKQCIKMFNKHYENFTDDKGISALLGEIISFVV